MDETRSIDASQAESTEEVTKAFSADEKAEAAQRFLRLFGLEDKSHGLFTYRNVTCWAGSSAFSIF